MRLSVRRCRRCWSTGLVLWIGRWFRCRLICLFERHLEVDWYRPMWEWLAISQGCLERRGLSPDSSSVSLLRSMLASGWMGGLQRSSRLWEVLLIDCLRLTSADQCLGTFWCRFSGFLLLVLHNMLKGMCMRIVVSLSWITDAYASSSCFPFNQWRVSVIYFCN